VESVDRKHLTKTGIVYVFSMVYLASLLFVTPVVLCNESGEPGNGDRTLYLVRHGQYDHEDELDPDIGHALIPLGVAQARLVADRLRSIPVKMTSLHSSTMTRARQTAQVIGQEFPELKHQQSRLLRECTPSTWREDIMIRLEPGESEECEDQLDQAFNNYFLPSPAGDLHDIIVCHGNVIRYFVTKVLGVDSRSWLGMSIGNCSLTVVRVRPDGSMKLSFFGDVGHLPHNLQTGLSSTKRVLVVPGE
jgi:serine/threonine-protein phosphatase PGAM5